MKLAMDGEIMTIISDRIIESEDIRLDGHSFVGCQLNNCRITYSGGYFGLHDTTINNPQWLFSDAAQRTINFLVEFNFNLSDMHIPAPKETLLN